MRHESPLKKPVDANWIGSVLKSVGLILVTIGLQSYPAYGFNYTDNRGLWPVGEIEAFMANTGIALSGSTGAVIYNPAGLAGFTNNEISLSANTYMKWQSEITPLQTIDGTDLDFSSSGIQAIPHSFVSTWRMKPFTFAFSILVPHQLKEEDVVSYSSPSYPVIQLSRTNYFQLLMGGVSVATSLGRISDVGVGCFYTAYQTSQMFSFSGNTNGSQNAFISNSFFRADVTGVLCNGGVQSQLSENFRIGVSAQFPLVPMTKSGRASAFTQSPISGVSMSEGPKSVTPDYKIPLQIGVGVEYRLASFWYLYMDVSHQAADQYYTGDLDADEVKIRPTTRFNGGVRLRFSKDFQIFGGVAYNPSAVVPDENYDGENFLVAAAGASWLKGNSSFGIGLMGARSSGSLSVPVFDASFEQIGKKSAAIRSELFAVLVSSAYVF